MSREERDYYAVLGIDRAASAAEIGRAYRRAARANHPDIHPDEPGAAQRFAAVTIAYETLSDPGRRASYDRAHPSAPPAHRVAPTTLHSGRLPVEPIHLGQSRSSRTPSPWPPDAEYRIRRADIIERDLVELARTLIFLRGTRWRAY
jgi:curved DNA-binding protein CbpA